MSENTENRYWVGETTFPENGKMVYALSDGKPITGLVYATYEDGSILFECGYKNGKQHGLLKSWYDDGKILSECNLKDGQKHGSIKYVHRYGELDYEENYLNGVKIE
jgi:antitoxin component YwqK of YwqJK toxin-antitoxin module